MTAPAGVTLWVWEEEPPARWPNGYDRAIVKGFDGTQTVTSDGFSWRSNYHAWLDRFGADKVGLWGVPYPGDGEHLGALLAGVLDRPRILVLDVEDFGGAQWSVPAALLVVQGFRKAWPYAQLGYSSYPTRAQCKDHGIPQLQLDETCDFAMPQMYYSYQAEKYREVLADHRAPAVILSPADFAPWKTTVAVLAREKVPVAFWRCGVSGWESWGMSVPGEGGVTTPVPPAVDVLRPTSWARWPQGRFVAWDGHGWWVTDGIIRREATQGQAQGLVNLGHEVRWWPGVTGETGLIQLG